MALNKPSVNMLLRIAQITPLALLLVATSVTGCKREAVAPAAEAPPLVNVDELKVKAERGDPEAQFKLGELHASGQGAQRSYVEAAKWYQKAAEQGSAAAQNSLGELREAGQGAPQSFEEAAKWYQKAAAQGHTPAAYNLAVLYAFGRGVPLDESEAVKWYRQAAEHGDALAQYNLGQRYELGKGVSKDPVEAYKWFDLAARSIPDSAQSRDDLKRRLTRQQIAEAQRRATEFTQRTPAASSAK